MADRSQTHRGWHQHTDGRGDSGYLSTVIDGTEVERTLAAAIKPLMRLDFSSMTAAAANTDGAINP